MGANLFKRVCIFILAFYSLNVFAKPIKEYTIGVEKVNLSPNYSISDEKYQGFLRDILDKFGADNGYSFKYVPYESDELYKSLYAGKVDFKLPDNETWRSSEKRDFDVSYSEPIYTYIEGVFVLDVNQNYSIENIKTLGVVSDTIIWSLYNYVQTKKIKTKKAGTCGLLIHDLLSEKIDGIVCNYLSMQLELKRQKIKNIVFAQDLPFVDAYFHLSTIKHKEVIKEFNRWLEKHKSFIKNLLLKSL